MACGRPIPAIPILSGPTTRYAKVVKPRPGSNETICVAVVLEKVIMGGELGLLIVAKRRCPQSWLPLVMFGANLVIPQNR